MKIMAVIYHDVNVEERTKEIVDMACNLGDTFFVTVKKPKTLQKYKTLLTYGGQRFYLLFIINAFIYIFVHKPDVLILHDNYTAIILAVLKTINFKTFIIYDSSELGIVKYDGNSFKEKIKDGMRALEKKYLKYANIVIAANLERAEIMVKYHNLQKMPICFDNMHKLLDKYNEAVCEIKFGKLFANNTFKILYGGVICKVRRTIELVKVVGELGNKFELILAGPARQNELTELNKVIKENNYKNIFYLGKLPRDEWHYAMNKCDISVSIFSMDDPNRIYCASGKFYESLFENKPVLVSENPPLKRLCDEFGVGVSTDNFKEGIEELRDNYASYVENIHKCLKELNYNDRIQILVDKIKNSEEWREWFKKNQR